MKTRAMNTHIAGNNNQVDGTVKLTECKKCYNHHAVIGDSVLCKYWKDLQYMIIMYDSSDGSAYVVGCPIDPENREE